MEKFTRTQFENQPLFHTFLDLPDPRVGGRCQYRLSNIIIIAICAVTAGANTWKEIEIFGKQRIRWLKKFLSLPNGVPSHQTFARVFALLDPAAFQQCFMKWIKEICLLLKGDIVSVDGKTIRGSKHKTINKKGKHIVNAFAVRQKMALGSVKTPDKSNEIKGIPLLLNQLDVTDCIVTIDAMGTQKGIAKLIRLKKANYVLALKQNHKRFYRKVDQIFKQAERVNFDNMVFKKVKTNDYGHQRIEEREYTVLPMMYLFPFKKIWRDFQSVIQVKSMRDTPDGVQRETRYFITSLPLIRYKKMAESVRQHWGVENSLHWKLDVGLNEDACQVYRGHADENLSTVRKIVLHMLQQAGSDKEGIKTKRFRAANNMKFLRKVVGF